MKAILGAVAATAAVCLLPASASAWTPEDCAAVHWDHPDCQNIPRPTTTVCLEGVTQQAPADQVPEGSTPGECVVPVETVPPPPVETPPVPSVPPVVEDQPPVDTPNLVPTPTPHPSPHPGIVKGKEQTTPKDTPVYEAGTDTSAPGTTLPFTGLPLVPVLLAGLALGLVGYASRRALRA